jgi:hypothetical protein
MNRRILTCVASLGLFVLMASTQVSSVYSTLHAHTSNSSPQSISTATWRVLPVATNTSTIAQPLITNIKSQSDPGRGTYFSLKNLGDLATSGINVTLVNSGSIGNRSISLQWCPGSIWDEIAGTCNGSNSGTTLLVADKRTPSTFFWNQSLPTGESLRLRLQKSAGSGGSVDATVTIDISRSYLRGGVNQIN